MVKHIPKNYRPDLIPVHQNKNKSLDVRLEFNGDFEDSVAVYVEESA